MTNGWRLVLIVPIEDLGILCLWKQFCKDVGIDVSKKLLQVMFKNKRYQTTFAYKNVLATVWVTLLLSKVFLAFFAAPSLFKFRSCVYEWSFYYAIMRFISNIVIIIMSRLLLIPFVCLFGPVRWVTSVMFIFNRVRIESSLLQVTLKMQCRFLC